LVSYVPKKNRAVIALSTEHHDIKIGGEELLHKPDILHYNATKGGVDTIDKMINEYSTRRTTSRWPLVLFPNTLDAGALNSYVIWTEKNQGWRNTIKDRRRKFILELGKELAMPQIKRRADNSAYLHKDIVQCIRLLVPVQEIKKPRENKVQGRCNLCPRNKDRKIRTICDNCGNFVCKDHSIQQTQCQHCIAAVNV
jgi:hypothetical protein